MNSKVLTSIVEQHAGEAAFLWETRARAVDAPHYRLPDLLELDERLEANLEGLQLAGEVGSELCRDQLDPASPGTVFAAFQLALVGKRGLEDCLAQQGPCASELVSALGFAPGALVEPLLLDWLRSREPALRQLALRGCHARRFDPGALLSAALDAQDPTERAAALRVAGALGRRSLLGQVKQHLGAEEEAVRLEAARAGVLLGQDRAALQLLVAAAQKPGPIQMMALGLALPASSLEQARALLDGLASPLVRARAIGLSGDVGKVDELIHLMSDEKAAAAAGEAFTAITGADLDAAKLAAKPREEEAGPDAAEEGPLELDPDEALPVPDPQQVARWWKQHRAGLEPKRRCLLGEAISPSCCQRAWSAGSQRLRARAAVLLRLLEPDQSLRNHAAPAWLQAGQ